MTGCKCKTGCSCGKKNNLICDCDVIHEGAVEKAKQEMLDEETVYQIADFYKALGDTTRAKIISLLDRQSLCVCDISVLLNMTKSAVSHQLKYLREKNLIRAERKGKEVWYSLADRHVKVVFDISLEHVLEDSDD